MKAPHVLIVSLLCSTTIVGHGNRRDAPRSLAASCRTYATASTTSPGPSSRTLKCSFDARSSQLDCTMDIAACGTVKFKVSYASRADFVDEVSSIPPRMLQTTQVTEPNDCHITDAAYTHDDQKRLVTYTLPEEGGASLRAAGFVCDGEAGGPSAAWHNRPNRKAQPVGDDLVGGKLRWSWSREPREGGA